MSVLRVFSGHPGSRRGSLGAAAFMLALLSAATVSCGSNGSNKSTSTTDGGGTSTSEGGPSCSAQTGGTPPAPGNLDCGDAGDWTSFGQNLCNTGSQSVSGGISTSTVGTLGVKWSYKAHVAVSATPTVSGGYVYVPDWGGYISKLDVNTGAVAWSQNIGSLLKSLGDAGSSLPGFATRNAPVLVNGMVIFGTLRGTQLASNPGVSSYLVALDQATGNLKWATLVENHPVAIIAGSPVVDGNTAYVGVSSNEEYGSLSVLLGGPVYNCCTFRGSVVAVDITTGNIIWKTYTISDSLFFGGPTDVVVKSGGMSYNAGKVSGFAGNAIWSSAPVVDRKRHQLYVTTGNNYKYSGPNEVEAGASDGNYVDSIMALDTCTGAIKWAKSFPEGGSDLWTAGPGATGKDSDFGAGANLFTTTLQTAKYSGVMKDVVGAGQKSGMYWALDPDTGEVFWSTQVGSGGHVGGIHWGTATDGTRIYVEDNFETGDNPVVLGGSGPTAGQTVSTGTWAAIDTSTGNIVWQIANPSLPNGPNSGASCNGPVAVVNGVLFAGSMDSNGTMFAFNAATGDTLWSFQSGATVYGGPAVSGGMVFWGTGYPSSARPLGFGTTNMNASFYAFALGLNDAGAPSEAGTTTTEAGTPEGGAMDAAPEAAPDTGSTQPTDAATDAGTGASDAAGQ